MFNNYFKIAWRNLFKNKLYSTINIGGLAIGMAVSFMLLLYVYNEYTFDKFHKNGNRIFQVFKNQDSNGEVKTKPLSPEPLAFELKKDFPEIETTARTTEPKDVLFNYNNTRLKLNTIYTDPSLLNIFSFDFLSGNKQNPLSDPSAVVLTESGAAALFGKSNPIGQIIKLDNQTPLKVSAVIKDHPNNSSFTFMALVPWQTLESGWYNYSYFTYAMLKPGASVAPLNAKIKNILGTYAPLDKKIRLFLYPYTQLHLYGTFKNGANAGGNIEYVRLFLFLAIGILIIACINFMNLSTARSQKRAREVGIRKAIGARRFELIKQFMGESLLMSVMAFIFSSLLIVLLLPVFTRAINIPLEIPYSNPLAWIIAAAVTIFTGLIAGSYPALFLSSFNPVKVLKGQTVSSSATTRPRQLLVIVQFTFAISLILSSIFIYRQIKYIQDRPLGYQQSGLIEMPIDGDMVNKFEPFRQEAIRSGAITDAALTSATITKNGSASWNIFWPGQLPGEDKIPIDCIFSAYHFINTFGLTLSEGRDFSADRISDSSAIILNEAAVTMMRLKDPIGATVKFQDANRTVVGVVKNFVWASPYEPVKPVIIGFVKDWAGSIGLRINPDLSVSKSLSILQTIYKKHNPDYPFEYRFTDESFNIKYRSEQLLGMMSVGFTCLAIIISCLGLFGLASFSAQQRSKEISIRKVLGASVGSLWFKLSQEFVFLVVISFIIGSAISWYYLQQWLGRYTYHTGFNIWVFIFTIIISVVICLMAVSWQAIRAALVNPVKNLRSE